MYSSAGESSYEGAPLAVNSPGYAEIRAVVLIELGHSRHRMIHLRKRLVINIFVAAQMILFANRAGLNSCQVAGLDDRLAVVPIVAADLHFNGRDFDSNNVGQQLTAHRLSERDQSLLLLGTSSDID